MSEVVEVEKKPGTDTGGITAEGWKLVDGLVAEEEGAAALAQGGAVEGDAPPPDLAAEIAEGVGMVAGLLGIVLPRTAALCNEQVQKTLGNQWAKVCEKRGWLQGGLFAGYAPEIAAGFTTLALAFSMIKTGKQEFAEVMTRENEPAAPAETAPA